MIVPSPSAVVTCRMAPYAASVLSSTGAALDEGASNGAHEQSRVHPCATPRVASLAAFLVLSIGAGWATIGFRPLPGRGGQGLCVHPALKEVAASLVR